MSKTHMNNGKMKTICGEKSYRMLSNSDYIDCIKCLIRIGVSPSHGYLLPFKCPFCNKKLTLNEIIEEENALDLRCDFCGKAMLVGCFTDEQIFFIKYYISLTKARLEHLKNIRRTDIESNDYYILNKEK